VTDAGVMAAGRLLGLARETIRRWVMGAEVEAGDRRGLARSECDRIARLERDNKELRRANEMADSTDRRNISMLEVDGGDDARTNSGRFSYAGGRSRRPERRRSPGRVRSCPLRSITARWRRQWAPNRAFAKPGRFSQ
jgi:transposase